MGLADHIVEEVLISSGIVFPFSVPFFAPREACCVLRTIRMPSTEIVLSKYGRCFFSVTFLLSYHYLLLECRIDCVATLSPGSNVQVQLVALSNERDFRFFFQSSKNLPENLFLFKQPPFMPETMSSLFTNYLCPFAHMCGC